VPKSLVQLIHRCLDKEPQKRPFDANEILRVLKGEVSFSGVSIPNFALDLASQAEARGPSLTWGAGQDSFVGPDTGEELRTPSHTAPQPGLGAANNPRATQMNVATPKVLGALEGPPTLGQSEGGGRLRGVHVALMLLCVLLVGVGLYLLLMDNKGASNPGRDQEVMSHVEGLIEQERFGEADYLLKNVERGATNDSASLMRVANLRERLDVGRLLVEARQREDQRDVQGAVQLYREILRRNAGHAEAQQRLNKLLGAPAPGAPDATKPVP
jgi:hypothetical protein